MIKLSMRGILSKITGGVSVLIEAGPSPGYINLETMLCGEDHQDLAIIARIDWDS